MLLKIITAPLIGGLIGYITNDIAIRMLFRPRRALYIGSWHIPFTPGLIPAQKERIASALGGIVASQLLDRETIRAALTSDEAVSSVYNMLYASAEKYKNDTRTLKELLLKLISEEQAADYRLKIQEKLTKKVMERVNDADIGHRLLEGEKSFFLHGIIRDSIAELINNMAAEKLPAIIYEQAGEAADELMDMRLCDIYTKYEDKLPTLMSRAASLYGMAAARNADKVLEMVDIESLVAEKVRAFDAEQLEQLVFGIMKRELRAIVYLGAMLGFIMGFVNLLILM